MTGTAQRHGSRTLLWLAVLACLVSGVGPGKFLAGHVDPSPPVHAAIDVCDTEAAQVVGARHVCRTVADLAPRLALLSTIAALVAAVVSYRLAPGAKRIRRPAALGVVAERGPPLLSI